MLNLEDDVLDFELSELGLAPRSPKKVGMSKKAKLGSSPSRRKGSSLGPRGLSLLGVSLSRSVRQD